jgi:hypothetical protein
VISPPAHDVTQLLVAWCDGDRSALSRLLPLPHVRLVPAPERAGDLGAALASLADVDAHQAHVSGDAS